MRPYLPTFKKLRSTPKQHLLAPLNIHPLHKCQVKYVMHRKLKLSHSRHLSFLVKGNPHFTGTGRSELVPNDLLWQLMYGPSIEKKKSESNSVRDESEKVRREAFLFFWPSAVCHNIIIVERNQKHAYVWNVDRYPHASFQNFQIVEKS